ncbi:MAG TPA: NERD domain-containing protein, partial [Clostridia bacterium]|nr:NERD domain-containing protein [Clostridia bacterium]
MIPSSLPAQAPPGERELFLRLRDDPSTADWTVLHSLDIACHRSQVTGECDFLVIIPRKGVVCVEVKSHNYVHRNCGDWYYGTQPDPDTRGPFKQASGAMHSIRAQLLKKRPDFNRVVFWSCVVLPYASGKMLTGEWHAWQLADKAIFSAAPPSRWLLTVIDNARNFLSGCAGATWFHPESQEPYPEQCKAIAEALRPNFEFFESPRARQERLEKELKLYTQEQCLALDAMGNNPRVAFSGPAGTGKTLLAMEAARRSANAGRRTLLLCFNRFLGMWLAKQVPSTPELKVSTLHGLMLDITGRKPDSGELQDPSFWGNTLPLAAIDRVLASGKEEQRFDELIIDEAQDLLWNNYIDFMDLLLRGGFCTGRWRMFGDFEKQTIFGPGHFLLGEFLQTRGN